MQRQKADQGCWAGVLARLRPNKLPLPSILLANVRSLANKIDELKLQIATNRPVKDCCVLCFTKTWLHSLAQDLAIELAGYTMHRRDRSRDSGKKPMWGIMHLRQQQLEYKL